MQTEVYSLNHFCKTHGISRGTFYNLVKEGRAPRIARVGRKVLITREAAAEWRSKIEKRSDPVAVSG